MLQKNANSCQIMFIKIRCHVAVTRGRLSIRSHFQGEIGHCLILHVICVSIVLSQIIYQIVIIIIPGLTSRMFSGLRRSIFLLYTANIKCPLEAKFVLEDTDWCCVVVEISRRAK